MAKHLSRIVKNCMEHSNLEIMSRWLPVIILVTMLVSLTKDMETKEINYFEQKRNRWQLKDHAKDSREIHELEHANCVVDDIGHFHFLDIPKYMFLVVSFFLFFIRNNILHLSTSSFLLLFLVLFLKMSVDVPQNASTLEMHS